MIFSFAFLLAEHPEWSPAITSAGRSRRVRSGHLSRPHPSTTRSRPNCWAAAFRSGCWRLSQSYSPMLRRYSRFRRAHSLGLPMPGSTSCSTMPQVRSGRVSSHAATAGEIHAALAQLAEDPVAQRLEVIPAFGPRLSGDLGMAVLEVDVPDAIRETLQPVGHGCATSPPRQRRNARCRRPAPRSSGRSC